MNVFETHRKTIDDYADYIRSFINISDSQIATKVEDSLSEGTLWPQPLLHFNPAYDRAGPIEEITQEGLVHEAFPKIFQGYSLYTHQKEALALGKQGKDFVVTSGTGSGKSLTYIGTIFDRLLSEPSAKGVTAVIVYPMNALINSQTNKIESYKQNYERNTGHDFPISFGQYTGQEKGDAREKMRDDPPKILLTNYMMLELLLTRMKERPVRDAIFNNLQYLVFDELHTYRGRQGADVSLLIRRIRSQCKQLVCCIGTSATMVSVGGAESQRVEVARVASKIFGQKFVPDQIVDETLARSLDFSGGLPSKETLSVAIQTPIDTNADEAILRKHPVAVWLENRVALEESGGRLIRREPMSYSAVIASLAEESGATEAQCYQTLERLLLWISVVNQKIQDSGSRYTLLPYKLHQFISQTGSVYTTLDQGEDRFITLEPGIYKQDDAEKPIFPNVFSRATGHPFICVTWLGDKLLPREFRAAGDSADGVNAADGYLIVGDDIWDPFGDLDYLPEAWVRTRTNGTRVPTKDYADRLPARIYFDEKGNCSGSKPMKYSGWFMPDPLLFDPTGGVFYDAKTNEGTKLTRLGSEGRSTSTTILSFAILDRLREGGLSARDQKLLSFTGNRQDAALQAGHFNDFMQVIRLRAGIHRALQNADTGTLDYATLGEAVFKALDLPFRDYGNKEVEPPIARVKQAYEEAFQNYLLFRTLADLRRSWRIVLPNLEQCALLKVVYKDLDEIAKEQSHWSDLEIAQSLNAEDRREFLSCVLDYFRLEYAIHSENYLDPNRLKEFEKRFRERLKSPWALDPEETLQPPSVIRLDPLNRRSRLPNKSMGPASSLGKYIKQKAQQVGLDLGQFKGNGYTDYILRLMRKLAEADYLVEKSAQNTVNQQVPVFQLRIESILWKRGDGKTVKPDLIKQRSYKDRELKPNTYFRGVYSTDFRNRKRLNAADHTGQLGVDARLDREDRFRADWYLDESHSQLDQDRIKSDSISVLSCSPTMELGVDIGGLSVVHMRNAPPNAANYVQRSGRAGRSGQGALVFTYCSGFSAHDRHYFQHQPELVAGAVQAPRIDLCNQELLLSHLYAVAVSMVGLPGLDSGVGESPSLVRLIAEDQAELPLRPSVVQGLEILPATYDSVRAVFRRVIADFLGDLRQDTYPWFTDEWIDQNLTGIVHHLDQAMERWRKMYRSARLLLSRATKTIEEGNLKVGHEEYKKHSRLQAQATRQLNLLRNEQSAFGDLSEFYPYRYLASEGFLPGYNFTRLPLRIFVPTGSTSGEFISRPRTIALREYGPLNLIYHNGRKYKVSQLVTQDVESSLTEAKISKGAGYYLAGEQQGLEICPFSGLDLSDNVNKEHLHDLVEMSESRGEETTRITCEEEERISRGFEIQSFFHVDGSNFESIRKAVVRTGGNHLLNLRFVPAARLVSVNRGWRSSLIEGFPMGMTSGSWRSSIPDPDPDAKEEYKLVKLWTSNLADALYIEPIQGLGLDPDGVITLQHALKRAIESVFQVEPSEIAVSGLGLHECPNILLYEAAEGSLGILSQLVDDVDAFHKVVEAAEAICRYEEDSYKAPASYDDLMSYYNQRDHQILNRFLIQDALAKLKVAEIEIQSSAVFKDYEEQYQHMLKHLDPNSSTEKAFIDYLYKNGLRLPDAAQKKVPGIYCQPDFYYEPRIWVFCDGTPHDESEVKKKDDEQRQLIIDKGDEVWSWHYKDDLTKKIESRPDIFKKVK